jgi:hypothetical protein
MPRTARFGDLPNDLIGSVSAQLTAQNAARLAMASRSTRRATRHDLAAKKVVAEARAKDVAVVAGLVRRVLSSRQSFKADVALGNTGYDVTVEGEWYVPRVHQHPRPHLAHHIVMITLAGPVVPNAWPGGPKRVYIATFHPGQPAKLQYMRANDRAVRDPVTDAFAKSVIRKVAPGAVFDL